MQLIDLINSLDSHGISTAQWGQGSAKTIQHLKAEIEAGESVLRIDESGMLVRYTHFLTMKVFCKRPDGKYFLIEDRQEFKDGRIRRRTQTWSVAEKLRLDEVSNIKGVVVRALKEELQIEGDVENLTDVVVLESVKDSPSYPGLRAYFTSYDLEVTITQEQFRPEGYREEQKDKTTFFTWIKV